MGRGEASQWFGFEGEWTARTNHGGACRRREEEGFLAGAARDRFRTSRATTRARELISSDGLSGETLGSDGNDERPPGQSKAAGEL